MRYQSLFTTIAMLSAPAAFGAYTYVDATDGPSGNTTLVGGGDLLADDTTGATTWRQRDNVEFGDSGTVFEGVEPSPTIVTTIDGLTNGETYTILVHFWDADGGTEHWNVSAGFSADSLTTFSSGAGDVAGGVASPLSSTISFDPAATPDLFAGGNRLSHAGMVGTATAVGGEIQVFIDDFGSVDVNNRTWYDGVSYQVIPEPSVALLGGLGLIGLMRRRRN